MLPSISKLLIPELIETAQTLSTKGKLAISKNNLVYLDITDEYIHRLFPLLSDEKINKPDYFGEKSAGAHITLMYREENKKIHSTELDKVHQFEIKELIAATLHQKIYYCLLVDSVSLLQLRKKYGLPDFLCFKGYEIGFHITIGTQIIDNNSKKRRYR